MASVNLVLQKSVACSAEAFIAIIKSYVLDSLAVQFKVIACCSLTGRIRRKCPVCMSKRVERTIKRIIRPAHTIYKIKKFLCKLIYLI